jgi:hypothetical protein
MAWFVQAQYKDRGEGTYWSPGIERIESDHARFDEAAKSLAREIEGRWLVKGRNRDSVDYPEFSTTDVPRLIDGWKFPTFDLPLRDRLKNVEIEIVDIVSTSFGAYAVSQKVIDIIEGIEPGIHQFIPYEMLNPDGSCNPTKRRLLNICTRAEVVEVEKSNVVWMDHGGGRRKFGDLTAGGLQPKIIVNADEASHRAIWCEWRYHSGRNFIVSDRFWNELQGEGIKGWGPHPSYPEQIEEV